MHATDWKVIKKVRIAWVLYFIYDQRIFDMEYRNILRKTIMYNRSVLSYSSPIDFYCSPHPQCRDMRHHLFIADIIKNRQELDDSDMDMLERMETLQNLVKFSHFL